MKRLVALMIIIFFAVAVLPVFAADEPKASPTPASGTQQAAPTKSMFQKGGEEVGCFSKKCENVTKEITKACADSFQKTYNTIKAGSPNAKKLSLRGQKSELERRRGKP